MGDFDVIYSPNVQLFRHGEPKGYEFLPSPINVSIVAASAYIRPSTFLDKKTNQLRMGSKFEDGTKQKIRAMLRAALENGHDSMVLSAFGSGAYKNPANHVAELFHHVLTVEFNSQFKEVVFAILDNDYTVKNTGENSGEKKKSKDKQETSSVSSNFESYRKVFK